MSERDEFEVWMREELQFDGEDGDPCKRGQCGYLESNVDSAWCAWQARAARATQAEPALTKPVAEVVSAYGDPEAFGERDIRVLADLSRVPYGTKLYAAPQPSTEPEKAAELLKACRRAVMALAHASERMPQYNADYQALSDAIETHVAARA